MPIHTNRKYLIVLILTIVCLPIIFIYGLGAWLVGLEGINPENHGKVPIYPVSYSAVMLIKYVAVFAAAPLSLIAVVLAGINMRLKNSGLNNALIGYICFAILWPFFLSWALSSTYVDSSDVEKSSSTNNQFESAEDSSFETKIIQLN